MAPRVTCPIYMTKNEIVEKTIRGYLDRLVQDSSISIANTLEILQSWSKPLICVVFQDTAGSERYESMSRIYYRGARAAIVCYDLTDRTSFERAEFWVKELKKNEEVRKGRLCVPQWHHIDGLVQERCNSTANALELHLSCTNPG